MKACLRTCGTTDDKCQTITGENPSEGFALGQTIPERPDRAYRRRNGIYYTPDRLAHVMARWAVREATDTVLDPSYGGCAFLTAAMDALRQRSAVCPGRSIYGVDLDPSAWHHGGNLVEDGVPAEHLCHRDFFTVKPGEDIPLVTVLLGNPPYVRHHQLNTEAKVAANKAVSQCGYVLSGRASYWAYFVLFGINFVKAGGRTALVLPRALLNSSYAQSVRQALVDQFERVTIVCVAERLFEDAEEDIVLVFAENKRSGGGSIEIVQINEVSDLGRVLAEENPVTPVADPTEGAWHAKLVEPGTYGLYDDLRSTVVGAKLGELAVIKIGAVTGANRFFVIDKRTQDKWQIRPQDIQPIISHVSQLGKEIDFPLDRLQELLLSGKRMRLFLPADGENCPHTARYVEYGESNKLHEGYKCKLRRPWYRITDRDKPDAFFTYMSWAFPRIVLNGANVDCTNAIHRLKWTNRGRESGPANIALGILSSIAQLGAEILGRSYGGGVLKLEPGAASRLWLPLLQGDQQALQTRVSQLLAEGRSDEATLAVDRAVAAANNLKLSTLDAIRAEAKRLRLRRMTR